MHIWITVTYENVNDYKSGLSEYFRFYILEKCGKNINLHVEK